jgi:hypothetical protein
MTEPTDLPERLPYRLLTGADDRAFCEKISAALLDGYVLYGEPVITHDGERMLTAQAVVLPQGRGTDG